MVETTLENVTKTFNDGAVVAVEDIDLHIREGELLVLVGPSGCGKSTTLRTIAGLEIPDEGTVKFGDHDVTNLPPKDRDVSMVFQNYALYPSMTVFENMAFGLRMRDYDDEKIAEQVQWAANMMEIPELLDRYPTQLSGGQQQRVAVGRAIVREPQLFLLDEPLSNLDARLRAQMRTEIQELQRELNVATVYVTHDQEEAMTMGDRIAVMSDGNFEQLGPPKQIYDDPNSLFVADFIGEPSINFLRLTFDGSNVVHEKFEKTLPDSVRSELEENLPDSDVILGVRPESMSLTDPGAGVIDAQIEVIEPVGDREIVYFHIGEKMHKAVVRTVGDVEENDVVGIDINWPETHYFDPAGPKVVKWENVTGIEQQATPTASSEESAI
ncbi:MAG: ABC transporter ATP-binding protein [Halodesulfurarchaeum sp.]